MTSTTETPATTEDKPTVRTYRVQYNPGQDIDADSETFIDADGYERRASGIRSRVVFTREGRTVAEVSEGNVIVIEEMDYTPEDRAARAAAMGRHPAGSELDDDGKPTPEAVLALPMDDNDSGADTVRGYLIALAAGVWDEGEGFSGKRPFGNSGWHYDLYKVLGVKGWIRCTVDSDGYVEDIDEAAGNELIAAALRHLAAAPAA
jgi:hypothetical protein